MMPCGGHSRQVYSSRDAHFSNSQRLGVPGGLGWHPDTVQGVGGEETWRVRRKSPRRGTSG